MVKSRISISIKRKRESGQRRTGTLRTALMAMGMVPPSEAPTKDAKLKKELDDLDIGKE